MNLMNYYGWKNQLTRSADDGAGSGGEPVPDETAVDAAVEQTAPDYSFLPEQFLSDDGPDLNGFKEHLEGLDAAQARWNERQATIPEDAAGYEFTIPEIDYKAMGLPEDFKLEVSAEDEDLAPLLTEMGGVLHQHGVPKEAAPALMGILAKYEATAHLRGTKAAEASMQRVAEELGSKAEARISTVQRTLEQRLPEGQAKGLMAALSSADGVKALETLLSPRGLGGAPSTPTPRTVQDDLNDYYANPT